MLLFFETQMRILVTNDDGIYAKGIEALADSLRDAGDVLVVAPEVEKSAVGHAITLSDPLKVSDVDRNGRFFGHALSGTPADCVKLGVFEIMEAPPDLVVSGINLGANTGVNLIYSGTVSAATEALILGIPSIALSLDTFHDPDFGPAAKVALRLVKFLKKRKRIPLLSLNVNVPALPEKEIRGIKVVPQGVLRQIERFERRVDPRGRIYYWQCGAQNHAELPEETDVGALSAGYVTITPIRCDLTDMRALEKVKTWDF